MATPHPIHRSGESLPSYKQILKLKNEIDQLFGKMKKSSTFTPKISILEDIASDLLEVIDKYHEQVAKEKPYLKNAIIDLTEIPTMHPTMQRIAISTALDAASKNLDQYLARA